MEAPDLERRLAAILAADVEGYSRLMHHDEEATMLTLSARRTVVDNLINEHRGRIANTAGDSVLAEFASVLDAVTCAVKIQKAIAQTNESAPDGPMRFRIGINVGDVMVKDGDIFGDGVNVAARLEALADGGGICVSRGVRDHLRHRRGLVFDDLGEQLVKNIAHPVRAYRLRVEHHIESVISEVPLPAETEVSADNEVALELSLWESVKDGAPVELASYLEHYPDGTFASLARLRQNTPENEVPGTETTTSTNTNVTIDALDLAFWDAIKESQSPEELTAYLESHPEGHFAALVRARLSQPADGIPAIEAGSAGNAVELAFWEAVSDTDDPRLLSAYLEKYQQGEFAPIALLRLKALREAEGKGN